jgi:hypothetical protein
MIRQQVGTLIAPLTITTHANFVANNTYQNEDGYYLMGLGETNTLPSLTVPDMTLPLATLIERYTRGQQITTFEGTYLGDEHVIPDQLERLTFDEKIELADELKTSINNYRSRSASKPAIPLEDTSLPADPSM